MEGVLLLLIIFVLPLFIAIPAVNQWRKGAAAQKRVTELKKLEITRKIEAERKERQEKKRRDKQAREAKFEKLSNTSPMKVAEAVDVASMISAEMDLDSILTHVELLASQNELNKALIETNESFRSKYELAVLARYGVKSRKNLSSSHKKVIDAEVRRCMELGMKLVCLHEQLRPYIDLAQPTGPEKTGYEKRKIRKGKTWKDLKGEL